MKKFVFTLILLLSTCIYSQLEARGVIVYHNGPQVDVVEKLPADCVLEGQHANLGVMYDQFGLFWLPVWNYGTPRYVLISDNEKTYWDLEDEDIELIKREYNVNIAGTHGPSLWNKIGLKPVIVVLIIWGIWSMISKKEDDEQEEQEQA